MQSTGATSSLDSAAAVKILISGREWITYDDEDTWRLKLNFARSQCLGGVMVWAVSHDTPEGSFSTQLQAATGWRSPNIDSWVFLGQAVRGRADSIPREQCRWMNCDESCPAGWQLVKRTDPYRNVAVEYMFDQTGCGLHGPGSSRPFCCPPGPMPWCGWYFLNHGRCNPQCPRGQVEIASYSGACNNGLSQLACCKLDFDDREAGHYVGPVDGMQIWDKCKWYGKEPHCGIDPLTEPTCDWDAAHTDLLVMSWRGSGAQECYSSNKKLPRPYCCSAQTDDNNWSGCDYYGSYGSIPQFFRPQGFCGSGCPPGQIKVTLDDPGNSCTNGGYEAYCCQAHYATPPRSPQESEQYLHQHLGNWAQNPTCPARSLGPLRIRGATATTVQNATRVSERDVDRSDGAVAHNTVREVLLLNPNSDRSRYLAGVWDNDITPWFPHVTMAAIRQFLLKYSPSKDVILSDVDASVDYILCNIQSMEDYFNNGEPNKRRVKCPASILFAVDPDLYIDPDDGGDDYGVDLYNPNLPKLLNDLRSKLQPRIGHPRIYRLRCGEECEFYLRSVSYINGDNGHALERANGDSRRYTIVRDGDECVEGAVVDNPDDDSVPVECGLSPVTVSSLHSYALWARYLTNTEFL
jgi:chitinase